jgi:hypothetical protein
MIKFLRLRRHWKILREVTEVYNDRKEKMEEKESFERTAYLSALRRTHYESS